MSFNDINLPDGTKLVRIYQSNNREEGIFGKGWSSPQEDLFKFGTQGKAEFEREDLPPLTVKSVEGKRVYHISYPKIGKMLECKYEYTGRLLVKSSCDQETLSYIYNKIDLLTRIKNSNGNEYKIQYDKLNRVAKIFDFAGNEYMYKYLKELSGKDTTLNFQVEIKKGNNFEILESNQVTYSTKDNGEKWVKRRITLKNKETTLREFNECCDKPTLLQRGKNKTQFEYNGEKLIKRWSDKTSYFFTWAGNNISSIKNGAYKINYEYSDSGKLNKIKDTDNFVADVVFDDKDRLQDLTMNNGDIKTGLHFEYHSNGNLKVFEIKGKNRYKYRYPGVDADPMAILNEKSEDPSFYSIAVLLKKFLELKKYPGYGFDFL